MEKEVRFGPLADCRGYFGRTEGWYTKLGYEVVRYEEIPLDGKMYPR